MFSSASSSSFRTSSRLVFPLFFRPITTTPPASPSSSGLSSTPPPKFRLDLGVSFAGKPRHRNQPKPKGLTVPGDKIEWRDNMVNWKGNQLQTRSSIQDAGEDFFFLRPENSQGSGVRSLEVLFEQGAGD